MKSQDPRCVEGHYAMHTPWFKEKGERRKARERRKKKKIKRRRRRRRKRREVNRDQRFST